MYRIKDDDIFSIKKILPQNKYYLDCTNSIFFDESSKEWLYDCSFDSWSDCYEYITNTLPSNIVSFFTDNLYILESGVGLMTSLNSLSDDCSNIFTKYEINPVCYEYFKLYKDIYRFDYIFDEDEFKSISKDYYVYEWYVVESGHVLKVSYCKKNQNPELYSDIEGISYLNLILEKYTVANRIIATDLNIKSAQILKVGKTLQYRLAGECILDKCGQMTVPKTNPLSPKEIVVVDNVVFYENRFDSNFFSKIQAQNIFLDEQFNISDLEYVFIGFDNYDEDSIENYVVKWLKNSRSNFCGRFQAKSYIVSKETRVEYAVYSKLRQIGTKIISVENIVPLINKNKNILFINKNDKKLLPHYDFELRNNIRDYLSEQRFENIDCINSQKYFYYKKDNKKRTSNTFVGIDELPRYFGKMIKYTRGLLIQDDYKAHSEIISLLKQLNEYGLFSEAIVEIYFVDDNAKEKFKSNEKYNKKNGLSTFEQIKKRILVNQNIDLQNN